MVKSTLLTFVLLNFYLFGCQKSRNNHTIQTELRENTTSIHKPSPPNRSVTCCLDSILANIKLENPTILNGYANENSLQVIVKKQKQNFRGKEIQAWLDLIDKDRLRVYGISSQEGAFYLFSAPTAGATGLETNFTNWLLLNAKGSQVIEFQSLCNSSNAFYLDDKGYVHFIAFDFNESFIHEKDYTNIIYNIKEYKINEYKEMLLRQSSSSCICPQE